MPTYNLESIQKMIEKDHDISEQLLTLLKDETCSLQQHDYSQVKDILVTKAPLLKQLSEHAQLRKKWLVSLYKVADNNHWNTFLNSFNDPEINRKWKEVHEMIETCRSVNETNGLLISRGQKTYSQLLRLLKGGNNQTELYTPKGNKQITQTRLTMSKA